MMRNGVVIVYHPARWTMASGCSTVCCVNGVWICSLLLRYWCKFYSIRVQKLLIAYVLDLLLNNTKVHQIVCACAQKFEYTMDDEVTKLMRKH